MVLDACRLSDFQLYSWVDHHYRKPSIFPSLEQDFPIKWVLVFPALDSYFEERTFSVNYWNGWPKTVSEENFSFSKPESGEGGRHCSSLQSCLRAGRRRCWIILHVSVGHDMQTRSDGPDKYFQGTGFLELKNPDSRREGGKRKSHASRRHEKIIKPDLISS